MPLPSLILLVLAAVCQFLIVFLCLREFIRLLSCWIADRAVQTDPVSRTAIGLPGTIAMALQAAIFNCALLVLALPDLWEGKLSDGLVLLVGAGFAAVGLSSFVTSVITKSRIASPLLGLSALGLLCLFLPYYLWAER
jgi:hypothetical protein